MLIYDSDCPHYSSGVMETLLFPSQTNFYCVSDNYLSVTETCVPLILPALPYMANLLQTNNRSVPAMEAALPATGALLSLAKHPFSQPSVWEVMF